MELQIPPDSHTVCPSAKKKRKKKKELFLKTHQQPMKIHNTPPALLFAYLCGCVLYTQVKLHIPARLILQSKLQQSKVTFAANLNCSKANEGWKK